MPPKDKKLNKNEASCSNAIEMVEMSEEEVGKPKIKTVDTVKFVDTQLPPELLVQIFQHLDRTEICKIMLASHLFYELAKAQPILAVESPSSDVTLFRSIKGLKTKVQSVPRLINPVTWQDGWVDYPEKLIFALGTRYGLRHNEQNSVTPFIQVIGELLGIFACYQSVFFSTFSKRTPIVHAVENLERLWEIYSTQNISADFARYNTFISAANDALIALEDVLKSTCKRRIGMFKSIRLYGTEELYQLLKLILEKAPIKYVRYEPAPVEPYEPYETPHLPF